MSPLMHFPNQFLDWDFLTVNRLLYKIKVLKAFQDKKGQKILQVHHFRCYFLQLAAKKKNTENGALGKFFGPSYFVTALEFSILYDFQIVNLLFVIQFSNFSQLS